MKTEGWAYLSEHTALATPYSLNQRRKDGKRPAAELSVELPHGKSTRTVTVALSEADLQLLAEKALGALRVLQADRATREG